MSPTFDPVNPQDAADAPLAPGLYLVATPIGNLEDITVRALRVLRSVDRIACEDTRQTSKLLGHFGISKPTVSYHLHNEQGRAEELVAALREGARVAVVSDAGTPGIADPGVAIVAAALAAGIPIFPIPGANAAISALIASGLSTERFIFHGFLPAREGARRTALEALRNTLPGGQFSASNRIPEGGVILSGAEELGSSPDAPTGHPEARAAATQIFYEAPHRIVPTLEDIVAVFGPNHRIAIARELTKLHEEFLRGPAAEVLATLKSREVVRGEMVLLLDGTLAANTGAQSSAATLAEEVAAAIRSGLPEKDALKQVAKSRGLGKSEAYREWQRTKR